METIRLNQDCSFSVLEYTHPDTYRGEFHLQDFFELTLVLEGKGTYEALDGDQVLRMPVESGSILFWDGKRPHRSVDEPGSPLAQIILSFGPNFLKSFPSMLMRAESLAAQNPYISNQPWVRNQVRPVFRRISREWNRNGEKSRELISALLCILIADLEGKRVEPAAMQEPGDPRIREALDYIHARYDAGLYVDDLARMFCLSRRRFSTLFKQHTQKTFVQYVNNCRLEKAKSLLVSSNAKIATVAFETGFENLSLFNKIFKRVCGITPQEFRNPR